MKPRIVREARPSFYGNVPLLHECHGGPAYLALPWPKECPWTPEAVMAACERYHEKPFCVPYMVNGLWEVRVAPFKCYVLTPEFMGEPKNQCINDKVVAPSPKHFVKCDLCGTILSDRRKGERRKGERRSANRRHIGKRGGRRLYDNVEPPVSYERERRGTDRRTR